MKSLGFLHKLVRERKIQIVDPSEELTQQYYLSRYPDATEDVPHLIYSRSDAEQYLKISEEFFVWVASQLKK